MGHGSRNSRAAARGSARDHDDPLGASSRLRYRAHHSEDVRYVTAENRCGASVVVHHNNSRDSRYGDYRAGEHHATYSGSRSIPSHRQIDTSKPFSKKRANTYSAGWGGSGGWYSAATSAIDISRHATEESTSDGSIRKELDSRNYPKEFPSGPEQSLRIMHSNGYVETQTTLTSEEKMLGGPMGQDSMSESRADSHSELSETQSDDSGSDANEYSDQYDPREDMDLDENSLVSPVLDPARRDMVDRVMKEFWVIFNQLWFSNTTQQAAGYSSQDCDSRGGSSLNSEGTSSASDLQKRKRISSDDDADDYDEGKSNAPRSKRQISADAQNSNFRFACPFRKHNPAKYSVYSHRVCALSSWETIARIKEHLYRCHQKGFYCKRCWRTFKSQDLLDQHFVVDAAEICQVKTGEPPDGITSEMERALRRRTKSSPTQTDAERWRDIYNLLFPNEEAPSPYFEPLQEDPSLSPDSRDLADFEEYARRELPRLVRRNIEEVLQREMQPVEASLVGNLVNTIRECQDRLFRSYLNHTQAHHRRTSPSVTRAEISSGQSSGTDSSVRNPTIEQSSFLENAFSRPPPLQNFGTEGLFPGSHDPRNNASSTDGLMFCDSAYGTDQVCNCPGPCGCTATGSTSQNREYDGTIRDKGFDMSNDIRGWQDWILNDGEF